MPDPDRAKCKLCQAQLDSKGDSKGNTKDDTGDDDDYQFYIVPPSSPNSSDFIIGVKGRKKDILHQYNSDLLLSLSAVLGNDNGTFVWGRNAFHVTGDGFAVEEDSDVMVGRLLDLNGKYQDAHVHLGQQLILDVRDKPGSSEQYRFLASKPLNTRNLILCFDGTSNHFSDKASNTNVVKLVDLLKKDDPKRQMVYYQTGVGTYGHPSLITPAGLQLASTLDEAFAWYLYQHVIDGYKFLMQTYQAGDRIALFGFSRGAFTARALAGMLHSVGLLPAHNHEHVSFAYEVYKYGQENKENKLPLPKWMRTDHPKPEAFKQAFCVPVVIDFVGVWDTVASVGALHTKELPHIDRNTSITVFRHALALDERRGNFIPSLWDHKHTNWKVQDVREVWFRGEHCDVGGGSAGVDTSKNQPDSMLSNISLRWMVQQIEDCKTGILFDHYTVRKYRRRRILEAPSEANSSSAQGDQHPTSDELDEVDVVHEIYDSIGWRPLWNVLEYFGLTHKATQVPSTWGWIARRFPNAKSGRAVYGCEEHPVYIHSSVIDSIEKKGYRPRVEWYGYDEGSLPRIERASKSEPSASINVQIFKGGLNLVPGGCTRSFRSLGFFVITLILATALISGATYLVFRTLQPREIFQICRRWASMMWPRF